jgi:hypothetical protein
MTSAPFPRTMAMVMDRWESEHFYRWLTNHVAMDERHGVEQAMRRLLTDHPLLLKTHSWQKMRKLCASYAQAKHWWW